MWRRSVGLSVAEIAPWTEQRWLPASTVCCRGCVPALPVPVLTLALVPRGALSSGGGLALMAARGPRGLCRQQLLRRADQLAVARGDPPTPLPGCFKWNPCGEMQALGRCMLLSSAPTRFVGVWVVVGELLDDVSCARCAASYYVVVGPLKLHFLGDASLLFSMSRCGATQSARMGAASCGARRSLRGSQYILSNCERTEPCTAQQHRATPARKTQGQPSNCASTAATTAAVSNPSPPIPSLPTPLGLTAASTPTPVRAPLRTLFSRARAR